jgi:diaminohydroxyphosphoribosylaminopyrimidine deaminase/5-amino-6-(5-phosphoribosylamino)uracil reductase
VIGVLDPYPEVAGKSVRQLRAAGVDVTVGVCKDEAAELAAPYLTRMNRKRPYVIAKWAQTLDGKLATHRGDSKWISNAESRRLVHRLRARIDAIIVGSSTVLADDPDLTARDVPIRRTAHRVVLDGRLRTPESARLVRTAEQTPTIIFTTRDRAGSAKARRLTVRGVTIIPVGTQSKRLSVSACLKHLQQRDMTNVVVEGGPSVLSTFFRHKLVDEAWIFTAPILLGDERVPCSVTTLRPRLIADALRPRVIEVRTLDTDTLHRLRTS